MARAWYGHVNVSVFFLFDPAVSSHVGRHGSVKAKSIGRSVISLTLTGVEVGRIQYTVNEKSSDYEDSTVTRKGVRALLKGEAFEYTKLHRATIRKFTASMRVKALDWNDGDSMLHARL